VEHLHLFVILMKKY